MRRSTPTTALLGVLLVTTMAVVEADVPPDRPPTRLLRPEPKGTLLEQVEEMRFQCLLQRLRARNLCEQNRWGGDQIRCEEWIESGNDWLRTADSHREDFVRRKNGLSLEIAMREYKEAWERFVTGRLLPPEGPEQGDREGYIDPVSPLPHRLVHPDRPRVPYDNRLNHTVPGEWRAPNPPFEAWTDRNER